MKQGYATKRARRMGPPPQGRGRRRGRNVEPPATTTDELKAWFAGNVPDDWFTKAVDIRFDRDEILVTGKLKKPKLDKGGDEKLAAHARAEAFREETRDQRISIAERAEATFIRKVSWVVLVGDVEVEYTTAAAPVMTRLRMDERAVLDTLIDAGVARSRSEALAWSVRLVAENESEWIDKLRDAMTDLEALRDEGPASKS